MNCKVNENENDSHPRYFHRVSVEALFDERAHRSLFGTVFRAFTASARRVRATLTFGSSARSDGRNAQIGMGG
jgi:hypothetical protein